MSSALSHTYNLLKGTERSCEDWNRFICSVGKRAVLLEDPGRGELSDREIDKLNCVSQRYGTISTAGLAAYTHEFPEWLKHFVPDTSRPIPWTDVLNCVCQEDMIRLHEQRFAEQNQIDALLATPAESELEAGA